MTLAEWLASTPEQRLEWLKLTVSDQPEKAVADIDWQIKYINRKDHHDRPRRAGRRSTKLR